MRVRDDHVVRRGVEPLDQLGAERRRVAEPAARARHALHPGDAYRRRAESAALVGRQEVHEREHGRAGIEAHERRQHGFAAAGRIQPIVHQGDRIVHEAPEMREG